MARKSNIARDRKRRHLAKKYAEKRAQLAKTVATAEPGSQQQQDAMFALQKLPRDSSGARARNRCALTGRPRGYVRKFGLCHNKLREVIMRGEAPGVVKASW